MVPRLPWFEGGSAGSKSIHPSPESTDPPIGQAVGSNASLQT